MSKAFDRHGNLIAGNKMNDELLKHFESVNFDNSITTEKAKFNQLSLSETAIVGLCKRLNLSKSGGYDNTPK